MKLINLGCGFDYIEGAVNVDFSNNHKAELYLNLNDKVWPDQLKNADEIYAFHVIEHLTDLDSFFSNCYMLLNNEGLLKIKVPCGFHSNAIEDPSHIHYFVPQSFRFFESQPMDHYHSEKAYKFKVIETKLKFENRFIGPIMHFIFRKMRNRSLALSWVSEFTVIMKKKL